MALKLKATYLLDTLIGLFVLSGLLIFVFLGKTNFAFLGFLLMVVGAFLVAKRITQ